VHRKASDSLARELDFSGVHARPHFDAEVTDAIANATGAANRAGWAVEGRQESIACSIDLAAAEASEFFPDQGMMPPEKFPPGAIA
jgi:hypothetical protein